MRLFTLLFITSLASYARGVLLRNNVRDGLLHSKALQAGSPLTDAEAQELANGAAEASKGEEATTHDDLDEAGHQFSLGAERIEAASNDAGAGKAEDSTAGARQKTEHELAERLERLAQENRRRSAEEIFGKPAEEAATEKKKDNAKNANEEPEEEWTLGDDDKSTPAP